MSYNISTLTRDELIQIIKSGDDNFDNQIRVTLDGSIYLSRVVGAEAIGGLKFRFETFDSGNGYVGVEASEDDNYIDDLYKGLKRAWELNRTGYIDYWRMI